MLSPVTFLTDSVKIRLQVSDTIQKMPKYINVKDVVVSNTLKQLFKGYSTGLLSSVTYFSLKYTTYNATKFMFHAGVHRVSFWRTYCGLIIAEAVASIFQSPFEIIKTQIISSSQVNSTYLFCFLKFKTSPSF